MSQPPVKARKSTVITIRLEPRLRFALNVLARKRFRSMTSAIEWALQRAIDDKEAGLFEADPSGKPRNILEEVWDPDEADRFVRLAMKWPTLLRFNEERAWKAIREDRALWRGQAPNYPAIRAKWPSIAQEFEINEV